MYTVAFRLFLLRVYHQYPRDQSLYLVPFSTINWKSIKCKDLAGFINKMCINLFFKYFKTFTHSMTKKDLSKYINKTKSHGFITD